MSKRLILMILTLCLVVNSLAMGVWAEETVPEETETVTRLPNECGEGITWSFEGTTLTIEGSGTMDDFQEDAAPWQAHKDEIEKVIIKGGVTYIGAYAFKNYDAVKTVEFGKGLYEIGKEAFASCDGLEKIWLPSSFKVFGEGCLQSCKNLKEIHSEGRFPSFRQNCLWDTHATIYYPAESPWGTEYIAQLEDAFKGRIQFLAEDGTDHYVPTEPEETAAETTAPVTEPETEPPTDPVIIETEAPVTEVPAQPETQAPETELPTEPAATEATQSQEDEGLTISTGLIIVAAVLAGLGLGALIFGRKKGKYSR